MFYDTHTHINDTALFTEWKQYIQNFLDVGGVGLVNIGVDHERNQRAIQIAEQSISVFPNQRIKASIGYHPSEVCFGKITNTVDRSREYQTQSIQSAMQLLIDTYKKSAKHIVAIGECGIDTHYDGESHIAIQKELFAQQCDLAQEYNLPIVIHSRDAFDETWDVIKKYPQQKFYFHCRGYGPEQIQKIQKYCSQSRIGFCGNITYPKAINIRESLLVTSPEKIVLETDAPYLAPQQYRGQQNQPAYIVHIYEYVARLLGMDNLQLQNMIANNVQRLYMG